METKPASKLDERIAEILAAAPTPLRTIDIVQKLAEKGVTADTTSVNGVLYRGAFDKAPGTGKPTWRVRASAPTPVTATRLVPEEGQVMFQVDGVGAMSLCAHYSDAQIEALLGFLATLVPTDAPKVFRHSGSAMGKKMAALAAKAGFTAAPII